MLKVATWTHSDIKDLAIVYLNEGATRDPRAETFLKLLSNQEKVGKLIDLYITIYFEIVDDEGGKVNVDEMDKRAREAMTSGNENTPTGLSAGMITAWRFAGGEIAGAVRRSADAIYPDHKIWEEIRNAQKPT